jgi:hypothetical protein
VSLFLAWAVFPLVLLALCAGLGLLVDLLSGRRLPGVLIAPTGLAAFVVVGGFTTLTDSTAELTAPLVVVLAILGAGLSFPWRFSRPDPWPTAAALGVFAVFAAPVVLSGEPTFAGYIKLDDTATWLAMTDRLMEHGLSLEGLAPSTYREALDFYTGNGYPVGANIPWGAASVLTGQDFAWTFQPYLASMAAMLVLTFEALCRPFLASTRLRALVAFIASQAALFYGFYLWGGIKELATAVLIGLAAAVLGIAVRPVPPGPGSGRTVRLHVSPVLPLALAAAALAAVLSPAGLVWIAPLLAGGAFWALRELGRREAILRAAWLLALGAVLSFPLFVVGRLTPPVENSVTSEAVLNLLEPLHPLQVFGVWPTGDFRLRPDDLTIAWLLAGLAAGLGAFGLYFAWRERAWRLVGFILTSALGCLAIVYAASPWVDGKAMATAAPAFLLAAMGGAAAIYQRGLRLEGGILLAVISAGVLWSSVLAYGGVSLAPYDRFAELERIGEDFAGEGPALMTEYNPYGARHFLRDLDPEAASELRSRQVLLRDGSVAEKGEAVDVDQVEPSELFVYRTLVLRRSPLRSRPPSPYRLAWSGDYYEVWQLPAGYDGLPPEHLALGDESDPAAIPDCAAVEELGREARASGAGARLLAARHAPVYEAGEGGLEVPRTGDYVAWLGGSVRGGVELLVDGRRIGAARHALNGDGGFIELGETHLDAGSHEVELRLGGADLHPGSGGFPRPEAGPLVFAPVGEEAGAIVSVPADESRRLCGQPWDWIEAYL